MASAKVSEKGQITLPAAIRRKLGIAANSRVELTLRDDEIVIRPMKSIGELYGALSACVAGREPIPWDEERRRMEEAVAREVVDE
jgi:AbrB family looped-hinge helix DNA binding protein